MKSSRSLRALLIAAAVLVTTAGCELRQQMYKQPKYTPFGESDFFKDKRQSRPLVEGTLPRGSDDDHLNKGIVNGQAASTFPFPIGRKEIERGMARFNIFCAPCHSQTGDGLGMIVQRGFKQPPSLHEPRLKLAPLIHYFNVVTNGIGVMSGYGSQIPPEDRWAIIAYIRALQLSQGAKITDVPAEQRAELEAME